MADSAPDRDPRSWSPRLTDNHSGRGAITLAATEIHKLLTAGWQPADLDALVTCFTQPRRSGEWCVIARTARQVTAVLPSSTPAAETLAWLPLLLDPRRPTDNTRPVSDWVLSQPRPGDVDPEGASLVAAYTRAAAGNHRLARAALLAQLDDTELAILVEQDPTLDPARLLVLAGLTG